MKRKIVAIDAEHLRKLIEKEIKLNGNECNLNHIDVSNIKIFNSLFSHPLHEFNGNISEWDVSNGTHFCEMFSYSKFDGDISRWNLSNAVDMSYMFLKSEFNGDISHWDVSNVVNLDKIFMKARNFSQDLSSWKLQRVLLCFQSFVDSKAPIPYWYDENVENIKIKLKQEEVRNAAEALEKILSTSQSNSKKVKI